MQAIEFPSVVRSIGRAPSASQCISLHHCPDVLELSDGRFAVIGTDQTAASAGRLPPGAGCGPGERLVVIPRDVLLSALAAISTPTRGA